MARSSDSAAARTRAALAGLTPPTMTVRAESAQNPCLKMPKSIPTMSPSARTSLFLGMPWTMTLLMEVHRTAGYGGAPPPR